MKYQIVGHGCWHTYYDYGKEGTNESVNYSIPSGALMLARLLKAENKSENCGYSMPNIESYYRKYFELGNFEKEKEKVDAVKVNYFSAVRQIGMNKNGREFKFTSEDGDNIIVWDEGFGAIDIADGGNKPVFWVSEKEVPNENSKDVFCKIASRCFLMIDADALRAKGAMISQSVSWERTVMNLLWQLRNNDNISFLLQAPRILITFAEDGVIYIKTDNGEIKSASLLLSTGKLEGTLRAQIKGKIHHSFTVMATAAVLQFPEILLDKTVDMFPILESGRILMESGYTKDILKPYCRDEFGLQDCFTICKSKGSDNRPIDIEILPGGNTVPPETWLIAETFDKTIDDVIERAKSYVLEGDDKLKGFPILQIGKLKTVDRWEIEAFGNVKNMMEEYTNNADEQPLSIAVFGSPGAGKSFGITQIAENLFSKDEIASETFNLSQFTSPTDLTAAFQWVRDRRVEGKLPLIFLDEFDSAELGWLKSFLAPMQDGMFYDNMGKHPLGKCIMVFAGSTTSTFKDFKDLKDLKDLKISTGFKRAKGPDFVSRIKCSIDIGGPNPRNGNEKSYILRRALLLRSLCERDKRLGETVKNKGDYIDKNIVLAMLLVPNFTHGARSMDTILRQSRIMGKKWLPSDLPLKGQISTHVNDRAFTDLLLLPIIENSTEGMIAKRIHEKYRSDKKGSANDKPWDELSFHFKHSNLNMVRSYSDKLELIGCEMLQECSNKTPLSSFEPSDINKMAEHEHDRWCKEKIENGWEYAPVRDDDKKRHDTLIEWDKLPEDAKEINKKAVENIIYNLESIHFKVYKK